MAKRKFPKRLSDGTHQYELARNEIELPDGRSFPALYERVPKDPALQFTPDLAYCEGLSDTPIMHSLSR